MNKTARITKVLLAAGMILHLAGITVFAEDTEPQEIPEETQNEEEPAEETKEEAPEIKEEETEDTPVLRAPALKDAGTQAIEGCDFLVTGEESAYSFDAEKGILYISGDVKVTMADGAETTAQRIIVNRDATVELDGINIQTKEKTGPPILIESTNTVTLKLAEGSVNTVVGARGNDINGTAGSYAGIEVEFEYEDGESPSNRMASLIIEGPGTLNATGGPNAAGIGGTNSQGDSRGYGLYGNITINSGTVNATAPGGGAGIGSSNNPGGGTSSGSYKKTGNNTWGTITINGGTVTAESSGQGAGIGGGNHVDSGKIVINDGTVTAKGAAGIGCGIGSHDNSGSSGDKGPGYYAADIEINGGNITATSNDIGAAIGGGMYSDAKIVITGGTIDATGGSRDGEIHHGGAGIGGGYLAHADITISGGTITATGGDGAAGIGSGGSPNSNESRGSNGRGDAATVPYTKINISGGDITATGGEKGGAGIGLGAGGDKVDITISGGDIEAHGAASDDTAMHGGAGIGGGFQGSGAGEDDKYFSDQDVAVTITGGNVLAVGGWGASGIGTGADGSTGLQIATEITIDADNADVEAYADGTKFAVDTRDVQEDGSTESYTEGRDITGNIIQGTFVHAGKIGDIDQNPEGLKSIIIEHDQTGNQVDLTGMPEKYRSFAKTVENGGDYLVYTDAESIGEGEGRYFSTTKKDNYKEEEVSHHGICFSVDGASLSDNFYLYPVKSIIVTKEVEAEDGADTSGLNTTLYYALWRIEDEEYQRDEDGNILLKTIEVVDGVPQNRAHFDNVEDYTYGVWEVDETGETVLNRKYGHLILKRITTRQKDGGDDNDVIISDKQWTDWVTVINTFGSETTEATIRKVWDDNNNSSGKRPASLSVTLSDGTEVELSEANHWQATVSDLPVEKDGKEIEYTWSEKNVPSGYILKSISKEGTVTTITNALKPVPDTSDSNSSGLYMIILGLAVLAGAGAFWLRRKQ
ncbi:MAG: Cna B-type domain-containing protein [Erysipelotrichaceae bacterium]|nr:Cna B-type domain-containing protein [Erysipelotrichaceae bacterium]